MDGVLIRAANLTDAGGIARIYNHYVDTSTATFDTQHKSVSDRLLWLSQRDDRHPILVACDGDVTAGWAALSTYRDRPAWGLTAEVAVYLAPECTGRGIGSALLDGLVEAAHETDLHALVSQVVSENTASMSLFERSGFERVGTMREVGRKFDRWLDVTLFQLVLDR